METHPPRKNLGHKTIIISRNQKNLLVATSYARVECWYGKMENYYHGNKHNHSERTCQVVINLYGFPMQQSTQAMGQPTITKVKGDIKDEGQ